MMRWLLTTFVAVSILSASIPWLRRIGVGRLPGDLTLRIRGREYYVPFMSTVVVTMLGSLLVRLL
jgi:hypothetical protein